jgi:predicted NUDIX family phosphoesterase
MAEKIICFRESLLPGLAGKKKAFRDSGLWSLILSNLTSVPRDAAENDPSFKQLVVYAVINSGNKFLSYRRTPKTTEERLRLKNSIGIGGHVNTEDETRMPLFNGENEAGFISEAMWREVNEEVKLDSHLVSPPELLCFINDDSTEVGRVHFGVSWLIKIEKPEVSLKGEKGIGKLEFLDIEELKRNIHSYENWSKIMIDYLSGGGFITRGGK